MAADWSRAPLDVVIQVAERITTLTDMARFGGVCKSWRSLLLQHDWFGLPVEAIGKSSLPRLMLTGYNSYNSYNSDARGFFDVATDQVIEIHLPEARRKEFCGSAHGWVVTQGNDLEIHLLNPLSREQVRLPPGFGTYMSNYASTDASGELQLLPVRPKRFIKKVVMTCSPSSAGGDCIVAALVHGGRVTELACVRPCENEWKFRQAPWYLSDLLCHKGHLYGIDGHGGVLVWDFDPTHEWIKISPSLRYTSYLCPHDSSDWRFYLAEVFDAIVAVARGFKKIGSSSRYENCAVKVFKLHKENWIEVKGLGDCCLFLGGGSSITISSPPHGCRRNCIYFTKDRYERYLCGVNFCRDTGEFSLDDGKFEPFSNDVLRHSIWVKLNSSN